MRAFKGLLKPLSDESLSSWLNRMYHKRYLESDFHAQYIRLAAKDPYAMHDADLLYRSPTFLGFFNAAQREQIYSQFQVNPANLAPPELSDKFCPVCFRNDIATQQSPGWRKSWRMRGACVCLLHHRPVLLSRLLERPKDLRDRAWQGFEEHLLSPASRLNANFALVTTSPLGEYAINTRLLHLVQRSQVWYQSTSGSGAGQDPPHNVLQYLLGLWLHPTYEWNLGAGIARTYFHGRNVRERLKLNDVLTARDVSIETASTRDLAVAYWLLGVAYGVITREEASWIGRVTRPVASLFPITQLDVARSTTLNYQEAGLTRMMAEARESLSQEEFQMVSWVFLKLRNREGMP